MTIDELLKKLGPDWSIDLMVRKHKESEAIIMNPEADHQYDVKWDNETQEITSYQEVH